MNRIGRAAAAGTLSLMMAAALAACGGGADDSAGRETIRKPGKTITVVEPPLTQAQGIEVASITRIEDARGYAFLSEEELIIARPNTALKKTSVEGEERYPLNLYRYDRRTKAASALKEEQADQVYAELSPDGRHLFYKVAEEETAFGRILNLETREVAETGSHMLGVHMSEWVNNEQAVFGTMENEIIRTDVNGRTEKLLKTSGALFAIGRGDGGLYYVAGDENTGDDMGGLNLYYLPDGGEPETVADRAVWVTPSPDGKRLAYVKLKTDTTRTLYITDSKAGKPLELSTATQVFGTGWSPDGQYVAYTLNTYEGEGENGLFVADTTTGEVTPIAVELQYASDELKWSPSGKRLMVSAYEGRQPVTYIIDLK